MELYVMMNLRIEALWILTISSKKILGINRDTASKIWHLINLFNILTLKQQTNIRIQEKVADAFKVRSRKTKYKTVLGFYSKESVNEE